jgi:hypothetical protein
MGLTAAIRGHPLASLAGLAAISLLGLLALPSIPQSQAYHLFADRQTLFGIPNFWNVVSNVPFVLVGAAGLWRVRGDTSASVFFLGVFLTGFGSSYYHWQPDDAGLFWDRLPMAIAFMAILANVIEERIDACVGTALLWPLVAVGVVSLLMWRWTGDLRLYGWVQFFPCVVLPLTFVLFPAKYTGTTWWFVAAGLYLLAKLLEHFDVAILSALQVMSGHALKHLAAAAACFAIFLAFHIRQPLAITSAARTP